jgi:invasion protein IalB
MVLDNSQMRKMAAGLVALVGPVVPRAASAQQANPSGVRNSEWLKICDTDQKANNEICVINQEITTDSGQPLASVAIREVSGEERKVLLISVPPGMLLQPGLRVQVDGGKQDTAKYSICFPNACYAELPITAASITQYKKGNQLVLTMLNQQAKPVTFPMSLSGFTKVYDGPALKPAELQARQQQLEQELTKRAEATRQRLIDEQRKPSESAEGGAAPAQ